MQVKINENTYPVEIVRKVSNKHTYIRVKEDCTLYVTTNRYTTTHQIQKLIQENRKAIEGMYQKQKVKQENNDGFFYFGKKYDIVYTTGNSIEIGQTKVFIGKHVNIENWYKKQAKRIFQEHLDCCYQNFSRKIPKPNLRIRKMTTRWGVCNYKDIIVTLNLELIKRDTSCLDYVIYHELSHLIEANHSPNFWKIVEENCPNYKNIRRDMKNY